MNTIRLGAGSKLAAEVAGRALQFLFVYSAQRALGPAGYGELAYALALGVVLVPVTDLGLQLTTTQRVSRAPERAPALAGNGLALKLTLALAVVLPLLVLSGSRPAGVRLATFGVGLALIVASFAEFFGYAFRGLQRVHYDAALGFMTRAATAALGASAIVAGLGFGGIAAAYLTAGILGALGGYVWLSRTLAVRGATPASHRGRRGAPLARRDDREYREYLREEQRRQAGAPNAAAALGWQPGSSAGRMLRDFHHGLLARPRLAMDDWPALLKPALPLGLATVLSMAYTRTAVFFLDATDGPVAVGLYSVAQKLTEPFAMIPAAVMAAVFPALVAARQRGDVSVERLCTRTLLLLGGSGAVTALAGIVGAPWIIFGLYGASYEGSLRPFQILALGVLLTFLNYALTHFVIALDRQRRYLLFTVIVFVLNLALCGVLIPRFGPTGAAMSALASEGVLFALCWRAVPWRARRQHGMGVPVKETA